MNYWDEIRRIYRDETSTSTSAAERWRVAYAAMRANGWDRSPMSPARQRFVSVLVRLARLYRAFPNWDQNEVASLAEWCSERGLEGLASALSGKSNMSRPAALLFIETFINQETLDPDVWGMMQKALLGKAVET